MIAIRTSQSLTALTIALCFYAVCTLVSMATMSIGAAVLAVAMVWDFRNELSALWPRTRKARIYVGLSGFLALTCVVSLIGAEFWPLSYGGHSASAPEFRDLFKLWYLFWPLPLAAGLARLSSNSRTVVLKTWLWTFFALSVFGIFQRYLGWPKYQQIPTEPQHYHAVLFLGHHLSVASIFIFPFFAALDWAMEKKPRLPKSLLWAMLVAGATTLAFGYSRTLWVALPAGIALWAILRLPRKRAIGIGVLLVLAGGGISRLPLVRERVMAVGNTSERVDLWKADLEFLRERPLTGVGWRKNIELSGYYLMEKNHSTDVFSGHAHNNALDLLGGTGILGFMAWLAWCGFIFYLAKGSPGIFCAWVVFQINGLTQVNFWEGKVEHQVAWVIAWLLAEEFNGQA